MHFSFASVCKASYCACLGILFSIHFNFRVFKIPFEMARRKTNIFLMKKMRCIWNILKCFMKFFMTLFLTSSHSNHISQQPTENFHWKTIFIEFLLCFFRALWRNAHTTFCVRERNVAIESERERERLLSKCTHLDTFEHIVEIQLLAATSLLLPLEFLQRRKKLFDEN